MHGRKIGLVLCSAAMAVLAIGCASPQMRYGAPGEPQPRAGDEIMVAGQLFHTGAPVVLWFDEGGYDAYRAHRHFEPDEWAPSNPVSDSPVRFGNRTTADPELQARVDEEGWTLENLQERVDQFVIHYDVCGTSSRCFEVLHDLRGLSVQFMLDVDGTIYQTLDCRERAWHAGKANSRSVGIEIANIGAYRPQDKAGAVGHARAHETLQRWYAINDDGWPYLTIPEPPGLRGIRDLDFDRRSARKDLICDQIHTRDLCQYDLTDAQYESLIKLTAALTRVFPKLKNDYPREEDGSVAMRELTDEEYLAFGGLIAHWHLTDNKIDPGPAFDWDRVVNGVKREHDLAWWLGK